MKNKNSILLKIATLDKKREVTANELEEVLRLAKWQIRHPPLNQPHYFKDQYPFYIVIDKRYGNKTIQRKDLVKKYLTRIKDTL